VSRVLIIGAGGAGRVATHKCAQASGVFSDICLASRRQSKCDEIAAEVSRPIQTAQLDASRKEQVVELIRSFKPEVVIHLALPYQNIPIMEACLETGVHYLDTALSEHPDNPDAFYDEQWAYHERFRAGGITGLLGSGFDPGVTSVFCTYARKHLLDEIHYMDIMDCNGGDHGLPFATNFNPEINLRELTLPGRHWEEGGWKTTEPLSVSETFDFPVVGSRKMYLMWHEELESLIKHIPGMRRARFWMTFTDSYLKHLHVLENVGLTGVEPVEFDGQQIVPLRFLKELLPDPSALGPLTKGKTCIGCVLEGVKDGKPRKVYIYNICDHEECYREVNSQAISYTTGVPAMIGALLIATGAWRKRGIYNMEQFDPDPFMEKLTEYGLPWTVTEL